MKRITRYRLRGGVEMTAALTRILNAFDKAPEEFLADEFKRDLLVDMVQDLIHLACAISKTKNGAISYGNITKCDCISNSLYGMRRGRMTASWNFSREVLRVADTVALELEYNTQVVGPDNIYSGSPTYIGTYTLDGKNNLWRHKYKRNSSKVMDALEYEEVVQDADNGEQLCLELTETSRSW